MDIKSQFSSKLSSLLFLEIDKSKIQQLFNIKVEENVSLPIKSSVLVEKIKSGENLDAIPLSYFFEGIFFVLGLDEKFKFNKIYVKMIDHISESKTFIKGVIAKEVNKKNYEDAYILLKGLCAVEENKGNYDKLLLLAEHLRGIESSFADEELEEIDKSKKINGCTLPYLYEAVIYNEKRDLTKAFISINEYISKGGKETAEVSELKHSIKDALDFKNGSESVDENPTEALKLLLPLIDNYGNNANLYYYIAVAYRNLENYEKAIYYLNESVAIDNNIVEVINELGVNFASLGDFPKAIAYFRKAFEATRSVEICTNLVMCYLNSGDLKQAKAHLDIAEKLDPEDEVVKELKKVLNE
ncbi:tetratricopeptide repeat protein [Clostridium sp. JN-9]|uniref:tetratricopeptide repeat protein n=1 Tax=Clostridium sp. JN-9 TaxID=2507159 RepID=UPI000FFE297E|nr:tetratricopeptide repeat protein [Clostridium sp. JN-9]QAT41055.1 tetratricopeptide repeat protein [Clostridium sp. JN-9]